MVSVFSSSMQDIAVLDSHIFSLRRFVYWPKSVGPSSDCAKTKRDFWIAFWYFFFVLFCSWPGTPRNAWPHGRQRQRRKPGESMTVQCSLYISIMKPVLHKNCQAYCTSHARSVLLDWRWVDRKQSSEEKDRPFQYYLNLNFVKKICEQWMSQATQEPFKSKCIQQTLNHFCKRADLVELTTDRFFKRRSHDIKFFFQGVPGEEGVQGAAGARGPRVSDASALEVMLREPEKC